MDSVEFAKPCHALPDYGGQSILKLIAYLPIMKLFQEKRYFLDMEKEALESEVSESIPRHETLENMQEDKLFKKESMFYRKYPDDDESFVNHPLKKRYAKSIAADYKDRKKELDASILSLAKLYSKDSLIMIGSTYWDSSNKARSKSSKDFEGLLNSFFSSFEESRKEKINKLEIILTGEFSKIMTFDSLKVYKKEDRTYTIKVNGQGLHILHKDTIGLLRNVFILKKDYELTKK